MSQWLGEIELSGQAGDVMFMFGEHGTECRRCTGALAPSVGGSPQDRRDQLNRDEQNGGPRSVPPSTVRFLSHTSEIPVS
jgi:hypothetical protein